MYYYVLFTPLPSVENNAEKNADCEGCELADYRYVD